MYNRMLYKLIEKIPEVECKVLESIVEKLCLIDVDIKVKNRRFEFSKRT